MIEAEVLLYSQNRDVAANTTAVLESLRCKVTHTNNRVSLSRLVNSKIFVAAFISPDDTDSERAILHLVKKYSPSLPTFLMKPRGLCQKSGPPNFSSNELLPLPLRYTDILAALKIASQNNLKSSRRIYLEQSITGTSKQIELVRDLVMQVADSNANVLISGESGTGKEVVARSIHDCSKRRDQPFVAVNCGAIPAELLESELFGHEKGAFTGAFKARAGRFELAAGGTLFLDEIGDMPVSMQVKLLRVLQERTFERVGGTKSIQSDVRLIAATHQNLEQHVAEGKFRLDLFYRLNVFPIEIPPLRSRKEDIVLLIDEFARKMEWEKDSPVKFESDAMNALQQHSLPGNIRELRNLVERLAILYPGNAITVDRLPERYRNDASSSTANLLEFSAVTPAIRNEKPGSTEKIDLKQYLASLERSIIRNALEESGWVVTQAAKALSIQRTTLIEKIRKLAIKPDQKINMNEVM